MYKIKIPCTSKRDLTYFDKSLRSKISNPFCDHIYLKENPSIERISIVYKKFPKKNGEIFTTCCIEILSGTKYTLKQVKNIIKNMRENGFSSKTNVSVQYIDTKTNDTLYEIGFQDGSKKNVAIKTSRYKNVSKYFTKNMWIRNTK